MRQRNRKDRFKKKSRKREDGILQGTLVERKKVELWANLHVTRKLLVVALEF